jgi:hypothetical protein
LDNERSPLAEAMRECGISTQELSFLARTSPAAISTARSGAPIPRRVLESLDLIGIDVEALVAAQDLYRAHRASGIEESVRTRMSACGVTK